jgi:tetratricopeptide (TPR) repeat protein
VKLRRTEEALTLLDDTLDRSLDKIDAQTWGSLLLDLALAMEQSGNPDGARTQLFEAQKKLEEAPPEARTRMFEVLLASGRLALRARDFGRAREQLTMAVEDARKRKSVASLIDALSIMSALDQAEGKVERSLALLDDGLSAAASVGDGVAEARLKQQAARILQQLGRIPDALHVARQALLAAQKLGWDEGAAVAGQLVQTLESRV